MTVQAGRPITTEDGNDEPVPDGWLGFICDLKIWYRWAIQDCQKVGRLKDLREYLEYDKTRSMRRIQCLEIGRIVQDTQTLMEGEETVDTEGGQIWSRARGKE